MQDALLSRSGGDMGKGFILSRSARADADSSQVVNGKRNQVQENKTALVCPCV